eukprot:m.29432 g.29432  ORF g.29432 m.29432 type:complete len:74 (+) comp31167_c0_seq6:133-354(+)
MRNSTREPAFDMQLSSFTPGVSLAPKISSIYPKRKLRAPRYYFGMAFTFSRFTNTVIYSYSAVNIWKCRKVHR